MYGATVFLFVTLINLCSLTGALVLPCMKMRVYKIILMFMVALAVGTLVGSGLLILIPEALGLPEEDESQLYIWKVTTVMGGIYLFFVVERVMRMVNAWRENKRSIKRNQSHVMGTFYHDPPQNPITKLKETSTLPVGETFNPCTLVHYTSEPIRHSNSAVSFDDFAPSSQQNLAKGETKTPEGGSAYTIETNGHVPQEPSPAPPPPTQVAPVAYMIVFGDALHNFIDGLSIGAAFSDNILLGVSVSVAVMCEELPHELGKHLRAMPEMNSAAETDAGKEFGEKKTFLLQKHRAGARVLASSC
nr:hypothetical protein BaRGS_016021 [Batillaria attramentaria]